MKILFNRITNRISGAERYNIYLLSSLKRYKNLDISFSSNLPILNTEIKNLGYKTAFINPGIREVGTKKHFIFAVSLLPLFYFRYMRLFKKTGKVDLLILESMTEKLFLTPFLRNVIWIEHGPLFVTQRAWIIKFLYKIVSRCTLKIICVSQSTQKDLIANGVEKFKTEVIYIGIDLKKYKPFTIQQIAIIKKSFHLENKEIISFLGTVNHEKGIQNFLLTAVALYSKNRNRFFLVIGDGDMLESIKAKVKEMGLENYFLFTGFVKDIRNYVGITDVLIFPTHHDEGLSISLIEANAMGIPVVANSKEGIQEVIVDRKNGRLYKSFSEKTMVDFITEIKSKNEIYRKHARQIAKQTFSSTNSAKLFYNLFQSYGQ